MMTPHGWQNLATERHRIGAREQLLPTIQAVHEDAIEIEVAGYLAYWLGEDKDRDLVALAWQADDIWFYACMNRIAVELGVQCTLIVEGRKVRVVPTIRHKVEIGEIAVINEKPSFPDSAWPKERAFETPKPRRERNAVLSREVFSENGSWYALVETKDRVKQLGPFRSKREAGG